MSDAPNAAQLEEMSGCLCFKLRRAARAVTQFYDATLKSHGLRVTQLPILVAAAWKGAVFMAPLAERLAMDRTTLLRNLRPLVRRKLVEVAQASDSRRTEIRATPAGRALVARVYEPWRKAQARTHKILKNPAWAGELETLTTGIRAVRE